MDYEKIAINVSRLVNIDTMTLDEFEAAGHEVWQVTQSQWVDIKQRHTLSLNQTPDKVRDRDFHKEMVADALAKGKAVPDAVLQDYPALAVKIQEEQEQVDNFRRLVVGDPISVKINYFGMMADGFFIGFLPKDEALVYVKVKGRSKTMRFSQVEIFAREGKEATTSQMRVIRKWRDALDQGSVTGLR